MRPSHSKVARLEVQYRRDDLAALLERALPHVGSRAELAASYVLVCAFWALIIYTAVAFALQ